MRDVIGDRDDFSEWHSDSIGKYELIDDCIRDIKEYAGQDLDIGRV